MDADTISVSEDPVLASVHRRLGIPRDYGLSPPRPRYSDRVELVVVGSDCMGREQKMQPQAALAWCDMRTAAQADNIILEMVSAYRSVQYQADLIGRHLQAGRRVNEILRSVAAPGFSEHHTGRALDVTTIGCEPLAEEFERTEAFTWLQSNAARWRFRMSYPRDNPLEFVYEPWHWCYQALPLRNGQLELGPP